ncbi:hypothetical protein BN2127_JRS1_00948 [Bacillus cereus]|nr:hypothetical protein BN2127_JRS1_00948 [Bacillus cereus]
MIATIFSSFLIGVIVLAVIVFIVSIGEEIIPAILFVVVCTLVGFIVQKTFEFIF